MKHDLSILLASHQSTSLENHLVLQDVGQDTLDDVCGEYTIHRQEVGALWLGDQCERIPRITHLDPCAILVWSPCVVADALDVNGGWQQRLEAQFLDHWNICVILDYPALHLLNFGRLRKASYFDWHLSWPLERML